MNRLRSACFGFYERARSVIAPGLRNAQFEYKEMLGSLIKRETSWLDLGCGRRLLPEWMPDAEKVQLELAGRARLCVGIDPDFVSLADNHLLKNRVAAGSRLPFSEGSFTLLSANMVIEHIEDPDVLLREARRVLGKGGIFVFHTPNLRSYATFLATLVPESWKARLIRYMEGRKEEDVFPTRYRMNTEQKIREYAARHGFRVLDVRMTESSAQAVMLGPLVVAELLWIRLLRVRAMAGLRSNIIATLQKVE
jgi:ubiquinone/menaquinone biosynthesis C-methylase UbiE